MEWLCSVFISQELQNYIGVLAFWSTTNYKHWCFGFQQSFLLCQRTPSPSLCTSLQAELVSQEQLYGQSFPTLQLPNTSARPLLRPFASSVLIRILLFICLSFLNSLIILCFHWQCSILEASSSALTSVGTLTLSTTSSDLTINLVASSISSMANLLVLLSVFH